MGNRARKVLLGEDERLLRRAAEAALRQRGYTVLTATDGVETPQAARTEQPDLILLDLIMPRVRGGEVLRRLKTDPRTAPVPVIVLTPPGPPCGRMPRQ